MYVFSLSPITRTYWHRSTTWRWREIVCRPNWSTSRNVWHCHYYTGTEDTTTDPHRGDLKMDDSTSHRDQHLLNVWWFQLWHEEDTQAIGHYLVPMSDASLWLTALQVQALDTTKQAFNSHPLLDLQTKSDRTFAKRCRNPSQSWILILDLILISHIFGAKLLLLDDELMWNWV